MNYSATPWLHESAPLPGVITEGDYALPDYMAGVNEAFAQNEALGAQQQAEKPKVNIGQFLLSWAGHLGDNLTGNPAYSRMMQHKMEAEEAEREAQRRAQLPQQVGSSIIVPDGQGGYRTLFRDPSTPEAYALAQGYQAGTPEFHEAVRQYRLGTWNDDATANRIDVSGYGYDRRGQLQTDRQDFSRSMQDDRQSHSDSQLGRRLGVQRRGQDLNDSRGRRGQDMTDSRARNRVVKVKSIGEARSLPPGTLFQGPDGKIRRR